MRNLYSQYLRSILQYKFVFTIGMQRPARQSFQRFPIYGSPQKEKAVWDPYPIPLSSCS
ncbi:hypothetical protein SUBVAR_05400 [Subdoligranulum variabile DSM 15176]|uniref:Uncharacterized protein n=1 Tax=Subdoligranulum variabile DSM 15176 TaxID=411471 RepID=D1PM42_9FIRM|nr:hypothetical protein SUBVAR_05400 [Subdoligranulum variabile DSM 15176]